MKTRVLIAAFLFLACIGCNTTRHQKPGRSTQSLPPVATVQDMQQPENPTGESRQQAERSVTTIDPKTGVVTVTTDRAETVIGGSQDLAAIVREKVGADHLRNLSLALAMGLIAWILRREWPIVAGVLAVGAIIVAFFGIGWALGFGGFGLGALIAYYVARSQLPFPNLPK